MSSWEDFETDAEQLSVNWNGCPAGRFIHSMPDEGSVVIEAALRRPELTTSAIFKAIKKRTDLPLSVYTLRRHRRGDCCCVRDDSGPTNG